MAVPVAFPFQGPHRKHCLEDVCAVECLISWFHCSTRCAVPVKCGAVFCYLDITRGSTACFPKVRCVRYRAGRLKYPRDKIKLL